MVHAIARPEILWLDLGRRGTALPRRPGGLLQLQRLLLRRQAGPVRRSILRRRSSSGGGGCWLLQLLLLLLLKVLMVGVLILKIDKRLTIKN